MTSFLIGVDGGGTKTTLALADRSGRELLRRTGPAGLVDPRRPTATARMLVEQVAAARAEAGLHGPAAAMCAGLAGVGHRREHDMVEHALVEARVAERVVVCSDGETALHGALAGGAGVLLIAGTGSVGYGRGEDGRVERCGGWGMVVGDEGSGYALGCESLRAALRGTDGRGPATELLPLLLRALGFSSPDEIPSWAGRAEKSEIAALAEHALAAAREGDGAAAGLVRAAATELAAHAAALIERLGPWRSPTIVVAHGGLTRDPTFASALTAALSALALPLRQRAAAADAVAGAVALAAEAARGSA